MTLPHGTGNLDTWSQIQRALTGVYDVVQGHETEVPKESRRDKMGWYAVVYIASYHQSIADSMYNKLQAWLHDALRERVTDPLLQASGRTDDPAHLFAEVTRLYREFNVCRQFGRTVFNALGSLKSMRSGVLSVDRLYLKAFHDAVYDQIKETLRRTIIGRVNDYRRGAAVDMAAVKDAVGIFIVVGTVLATDEEAKREVYHKDFEAHYLDALRMDLQREVALKITEGSSAYLQWVEARLELEEKLATELLQSTSAAAVREATIDEVLRAQYQQLVDDPTSGCLELLRQWRTDELRRMYQLVRQVPVENQLDAMGAPLRTYITTDLKRLVTQFEMSTASGYASELALVLGVLDLYRRYREELIVGVFSSDGCMQRHLRCAFEDVLNVPLQPQAEQGTPQRTTTFGEAFSIFADAVLRHELGDVVEPEAEDRRLDDLVSLVSYLRQRDEFQQAHRKRLLRRLLQTTPDQTLEGQFLQRLKNNFGQAFTGKMETMLTDRESALALAEQFASHHTCAGFEPLVLMDSAWAPYPSMPLTLPEPIDRYTKTFKSFYEGKYRTRRLRWEPMLGQAHLVLELPKGTKDVTAQLPQACVLLLLGGGASTVLTLQEIATRLSIDAADARNIVATMCRSRFPLLLCQRAEPDVVPQPPQQGPTNKDFISLNMQFASKTRKLRLPAFAEKLPNRSEDQLLNERRKLQLEASIVRLMKSRKRMKHADLHTELMNIVQRYFVPTPIMTKRVVEDLISREYLKRDEADPSIYEYVA